MEQLLWTAGLTFVVVVERLWRDCGCTSKFVESLFPGHSAVAWCYAPYPRRKAASSSALKSMKCCHRNFLSWAPPYRRFLFGKREGGFY